MAPPEMAADPGRAEAGDAEVPARDELQQLLGQPAARPSWGRAGVGLLLALVGCATAAAGLAAARRSGERPWRAGAAAIGEAVELVDEGLTCDESKCLENDKPDKDCCAMPGQASCADDYWFIPGFKCFDNGALKTCCRKPPEVVLASIVADHVKVSGDSTCARPEDGKCTENGKKDADCCALEDDAGCAAGYKYFAGDVCFKANGARSSCCMPVEEEESEASGEAHPWECHRYDLEAGEGNEWCRTVGTKDGKEYLFTHGGGTCGKCWCCERPAKTSAKAHPAPEHEKSPSHHEAPAPTPAPAPAEQKHHATKKEKEEKEEKKEKEEKEEKKVSPLAHKKKAAKHNAKKEKKEKNEKEEKHGGRGSSGDSGLEPLGDWQCHRYSPLQGNDWCKMVGVQKSEDLPEDEAWEHKFELGGGTVGDCWCIKRRVRVPPLEPRHGAKSNATWKCHDYEDGQDNQWCATVGIHKGMAYTFKEGGGLCGKCWCCKRDVQPGDCGPAGENCADSQCCSQQGMQCYVKNEYWSSCGGTCADDDWSCKRLGVRSAQKVQCTWPGLDCSLTKQCCNSGTKCIRQNANSAWCTSGQIPPDWDGTVIGGARQPWPIGPAGPDDAVAGTSLFCFMAVLPGSAEVSLQQAAEGVRGSIYGCDEHKVYWSGHSSFVHKGSWNSWVNTDVFVKVWEQVRDDGRYKKHDWTIKVDPDSVFIPSRLKYKLQQLRPPAGKPIYLENSGVSKLKFLGSIEIVSKEGLDLYFESYQDCHVSISGHTGEDGFMKGCFDSVGVGFMTDFSILQTPFDTTACTDTSRVCFHPRKDAAGWLSCWNNAQR